MPSTAGSMGGSALAAGLECATPPQSPRGYLARSQAMKRLQVRTQMRAAMHNAYVPVSYEEDCASKGQQRNPVFKCLGSLTHEGTSGTGTTADSAAKDCCGSAHRMRNSRGLGKSEPMNPLSAGLTHFGSDVSTCESCESGASRDAWYDRDALADDDEDNDDEPFRAAHEDSTGLLRPSLHVEVLDKRGARFWAMILMVDHVDETYKVRTTDGQLRVIKASAVQQVLG
mmetsp:Transcript_76808/g.178160  ORF Transcript_76808/g.178160 Transcript_76808/m.178160 type:complete len:228 (+) Transcript_76808:66-749(+)